MTLPTSGPISLFDICDEFSLAHTTPFPSGFYGLGGAPTSGPLSFADFYGRSAYVPPVFAPDGGAVGDDQIAPANPSVTLSCTKPAFWSWSLSSGSAAGLSGSVPSGSTSNKLTFVKTTAGTATIGVSGTSEGVIRNFVVTLTKEANGGNL